MKGSAAVSWSGVEANQPVSGTQPKDAVFQLEGALNQPVEAMGVDGVSGEWIGHLSAVGGQKWSSVKQGPPKRRSPCGLRIQPSGA